MAIARCILQTCCISGRTAKKPTRFVARCQSTRQHQQNTLAFPDSFLHRRGDHPYGSREYLLVQPVTAAGGNATKIDAAATAASKIIHSPDGSQLQILASLNAHRNIVFGASVRVVQQQQTQQRSFITVLDLCPPLLRAALEDCAADGEQPQALSTLHGLSAYVRACVVPQQQEGNVASSPSLRSPARDRIRLLENGETILEAVTAIATGIPRHGHTTVGQGTHRDGAIGWEAFAREFVLTQPDPTGECVLYQQAGAELVTIELLADTQPAYLASSGGAMARFFFV